MTLDDWATLSADEWVSLLLGLSDASRLRAAVAAEEAPSATVGHMPRPASDPDAFLARLRRHQGKVHDQRGAA